MSPDKRHIVYEISRSRRLLFRFFLFFFDAQRNPLQNQAKAQQPKAQVHEGLLHKGHLSVDV
jgi:hypothetical protein